MKEIKEKIKKANLALTQIILFGSRARGNHTTESNWDILIILKEQINPPERRNIWQKIYKTLPKML